MVREFNLPKEKTMGDNAKCNENQKTVQGQRLRTVLQFSRDYGVHPNTVYNWIADGSLPCLKVRHHPHSSLRRR